MTVTTEMHVRVWVTEVWDAVRISVTPDSTVTYVKKAALREATGREPDPGRYVVKFRGAKVTDETSTLRDLGVPDGAGLIVHPSTRQPVR